MKLRIIDGVEVHSRSGNVYADLGLADAEQIKIKTIWFTSMRSLAQAVSDGNGSLLDVIRIARP